MITEDYVSFETAKLLKEKGFDADIEHDMWYVVEKFSTGCHWNSCTYKVGDITREYDEKCCIVMPTLWMAMKWLRNIYHIEIYPFHDAIQENNDWWYRIERHFKGCGLPEHESDVIYKTYEEACEAAIKYCLENLI